jgi:hypothetical protein
VISIGNLRLPIELRGAAFGRTQLLPIWARSVPIGILGALSDDSRQRTRPDRASASDSGRR